MISKGRVTIDDASDPAAAEERATHERSFFDFGKSTRMSPGNDAPGSQRVDLEIPAEASVGPTSAGWVTEPSVAQIDRPATDTNHAGPRQLRRLLDAVMLVGSDLDLAMVLRRIVEAARELAGARYAALGVLDPSRTYLAEFITVGLDDDQRARIGELPKGHGILGLLIVDPRPIRLPDLGEHPESFGFPAHHPPMKSFLGVPLYVRGEVFGNLYLTDKEDEDGFSDIDEELVLSLATAAALAIDNARLHQRAGEVSLLADRERIGRDLHDTVVQRLFATGLAMHGTANLAEQPEVVHRMQQHVDDLDSTIRQIRMAIFKLEAPRSSDPSLRRDVLDLVADQPGCSASSRRWTSLVRLTALSPRRGEHLLAVLREALSNVAHHAGATHVEVTVRADSNLLLEVVDDGRGVGPEPNRQGNGLRNIMGRAEELGGSAYIAPGADRGTRLQWVVPLTTDVMGT